MKESTKRSIGRLCGAAELIIGLLLLIASFWLGTNKRLLIQSIIVGLIFVVIGLLFLVNYRSPLAKKWF